jgi:hypothetical protein
MRAAVALVVLACLSGVAMCHEGKCTGCLMHARGVTRAQSTAGRTESNVRVLDD